MLRKELEESAGRMWVWHAGVRNCVIGKSADADMLATWPNATATHLSYGLVMGRPSLGLLK